MTIVTLLGQTLYLGSLCVLGLVLHRLTRFDATLMALVAGILGALALPVFDIDTGIRAHNIKDLVFYVILPVLIFGAAWHLKPALLQKWLLPVVLLATVGVLVSFLVIAALAYYGIGSPRGFPWVAALLLGAILSATDPVAIVNALDRLKAPEDLKTIIEGESLLNDGTAVVLFTVMLGIAVTMGDDADGQYGGYLLQFLYASLGGLLIGALLAGLTVALVLLIATRAATTILLLMLAFGSFFVAEHFFHVSGILSIMTAAIVSKLLLHRFQREQNLQSGIEQTWDWALLFLNSLIFVLMGLVINFAMFTDQWLAILIAIGAMLASRALVVFGVGWQTRFNRHRIPMGWQYIMACGGLRGAIAIVLVLSLPTTLPYWWTMQSMVFGAVLFTLVVQGLAAGLLIRRYGH